MKERRTDFEPAGTCARDVADEQLAHGVLEFLREDGRAARRRRLDKLRAQLAGGGDYGSSGPPSHSYAWGTAAMLAASVLVVVWVFWSSGQQGSASDALLALQDRDETGVRYQVGVEDGEAQVLARWDFGDAPERLLELYPQESRQARSVLRDADGACFYQAGSQGVRGRLGSAEWPKWFEYDGLLLPLRSPWEWVASLSQTHEVSWKGRGRVVGRRSAGAEAGSPDSFELTTDGLGGLRTLELCWLSPGSADEALDEGARRHGAPGAVDPGAVDPGAVDPGAVDPGAWSRPLSAASVKKALEELSRDAKSGLITKEEFQARAEIVKAQVAGKKASRFWVEDPGSAVPGARLPARMHFERRDLPSLPTWWFKKEKFNQGRRP